MKKSSKKTKSVITDLVMMETQTVYHEDGTIKTTPLEYELGQQITCSGGIARYKANIVVDPDGNVTVTPSKSTGKERYSHLMETKHGEVLETKKHVIVKLKFLKSNGRWKICDMLEDEVDDMGEFLETTNKIEQWQ